MGVPASADSGRWDLGWHPDDPRDPLAVAVGRHWARQVLPLMARNLFTRRLRDTVDLVVTELIANAVRHGDGVRTVRMVRQGTLVTVTVCDHSQGVPQLVWPTDVHCGHGRGLVLVAALTDRWGYVLAEPCKTVWAEVNLTATRALPEHTARPRGVTNEAATTPLATHGSFHPAVSDQVGTCPCHG